jgi:hypothetical protein
MRCATPEASHPGRERFAWFPLWVVGPRLDAPGHVRDRTGTRAKHDMVWPAIQFEVRRAALYASRLEPVSNVRKLQPEVAPHNADMSAPIAHDDRAISVSQRDAKITHV